MAYDTSVKQYLQGKGVASSDIGYDKPSGQVTVRGQNFYKPELNTAGTTYSSQQNLDNAFKTYSTQRPVIQPNGTTGYMGTAVQPTQGNAFPGALAGAMVGIPKTGIPNTTNVIPPTTPQTTPPVSNVSPYAPQYADIMKQLDISSKALQQPTDIYSSPEYAAAKAQQDKSAGLSTRQAQESMGASGFGRSTNLQDRAQNIQNEANNYLQTQLVPQIQNAIQSRNQQQYSNLLSQFNVINQQVQQAQAQSNADREFKQRQQEAATTATGVYNPSGLSYQDVQAQLDKNSAAYATATPEEQQRLHTENIALGQQLGKTYQPQTGTYSVGQGFVGTKTMQAKQLENQLNEVAYNHARDSLLDKRYEDKFNQDIKQQGFENAVKIAVQQHQISNDNAQIAISRANQGTSAERLAWEKNPSNPSNIYKSARSEVLSNKPADNKLKTAEGYSSYTDGVAKYAVNQSTGIKNLSNPIDVETSILQSNLPESEMRKLYTRYGLKWGG